MVLQENSVQGVTVIIMINNYYGADILCVNIICDMQ